MRVCRVRERGLPRLGGDHAQGIQPQAGTAIRAHQGQREKRGQSGGRAKEIAARTVNSERVRSGESKTASRTSTQDTSSSQRGRQRSHRGAQGPTYAQLYAQGRRGQEEGQTECE